MSPSGRKILDELRDGLQSQVDELERVGAEHLDRLAERGVRELEDLREQMRRSGEGEFDEEFEEEPASRRFRRRGHRRRTRVAASAEKLERKAERAARKAMKASNRSRRHSRRPKRTRAALDPAEREHRKALSRARRRANQRLGFITHFGSYLATLALILVATRSLRIVTVVALGWGIGVFCHYLWAMAAPSLRDRWIEQEVGTRSARDVRSERKQVETRSRRSLEDLSASIAHEIRNPITAAKSLVQQMGEDPASEENLEYAGLALSELDRVERSISHLLRYARDEEPRFESLDLRDIAASAVSGLRDRAESAGVSIALDFDRPGEIRGDAEKLRRVLENLIGNAIDALAEVNVGDPRIEIRGGENLAATEIWLRVLDNGLGIDPQERERIWSPFYTTKTNGTGLGLALSRKTVEAHGGRIELLDDVGPGTEFVLSFPRDPGAMADSVTTAGEVS